MDCPYKAWIERSEELWRKREEMMTHRHSWAAEAGEDDMGHIIGYDYYCEGCDTYLGSDEVERRLNAVENLSAENAETAAEVVWNHRIGTMPDEELDAWVESLRAYAKALGGEDA